MNFVLSSAQGEGERFPKELLSIITDVEVGELSLDGDVDGAADEAQSKLFEAKMFEEARLHELKLEIKALLEEDDLDAANVKQREASAVAAKVTSIESQLSEKAREEEEPPTNHQSVIDRNYAYESTTHRLSIKSL